MKEYLEKLNEKQRLAVTSNSQYLRIIAGAGSGKTRVLTTRIAYLINELGIVPESILAITFTNKAANEMRTRIEKMLGPNGCGAHISTIHSFCVTVLRSEIRYENYPSNFTILDGDDQKSIIKEAIKELKLEAKEYNASSCLDYVGNMKVAGFDYQSALNMANNYHQEGLANIYKYYLERCQQLYALDFDDLLLFTNRIFKKNPNVRAKWQKKFNYILVDEFQDIDNVQYELINLLANDNTYLCVVGDPDQTIYSWRGANINIIMDFIKKYPKTETIVLEKNYRSTQNILNGANSIIKYNKHRVAKDLYTDNPEGDKIVAFTAGSDENEAMYVVKRILDLTDKKVKYKDIAILYRNNYLSRNIEKALIDLKIPYIIYGGIRFYERAEIKDMLSYLRMISVADDLSLKRIINVPKRGIGNKTVEDLFDFARKEHKTIYDILNVFPTSSSTSNKLKDFKELIESFKNKKEELSLCDLFNTIFETTGYRNMLETSNDPKDMERLDNVKELLNDIVNFQNINPNATLDDYLANVALYTDIVSKDADQYVSLMTVHAAKGLEYDNVFVIGMSEGIFPSARSLEESGIAGLEEERRLAYVAFTRAKKRLFLSDSRGYSYTTSSEKETSRFIHEIDEEFLDIAGVNKKIDIESDAQYDFNKPASTKYRKGDLVYHEAFGDGVIIAIEDNKIATIAFPYPYQTKKIALNFPKLHKKEKKNE